MSYQRVVNNFGKLTPYVTELTPYVTELTPYVTELTPYVNLGFFKSALMLVVAWVCEIGKISVTYYITEFRIYSYKRQARTR